MAGRNLPDAPQAVGTADTNTDTNSISSPVNENQCGISGTVMDTNEDVIQGARVTLSGPSGEIEREVQSGPNGQFQFEALPAGSYQVTVSGKDMGASVSPWFEVQAGEMRVMRPVVLSFTAEAASVTVVGERQELNEEQSEEQVQIAVGQRIWGVFPNFYSSYNWNAPAMLPKQKFQLAFRSVTDPMAFAGAAGIAGFEQYNGIFPGYGGGIAGFFKRYGAAYTNDFSARMLSGGVFATLFHQDPRYFYKGTGSFGSRTFYALSRSVIARDDNGRWRPNYSRLLGVFAAAALSNLYYPAENRGVDLTLVNGAVETAGNAGTDFAREFILKGITSHAGGKP